MIFKTNSMKTFIYIITILITSLVSAQFSENFGPGRSRVFFYANSTYGFQNDLYDTSTACYVVGPGATNLPSQTVGYEVSNTSGASGGGAIELIDYMYTPADSQFIIDNINTTMSNSISLNAKTNHTIYNIQPLQIQYWNGSAWAQLYTNTVGLYVVNNTWHNYIYLLPAAAKQTNLKLRIFTNSNIRPTGNIGSFYTSIDDIKTDNTLSNDDFSFKNFKIYPNPAKSRFTINLGNEFYTNYEIKIFNLIGQEVYSSKIVNSIFEINKTWSGEGIYFVKILNSFGELVIIRKIIMLN